MLKNILRGDVMADNEDLVTLRKEAYEYIKNTLYQPPWNIPLDISDAKLADVLGGTLELHDSLRLLRDGKHNPTKRLITAFRDFVKGFETDAEVNAHLVTPFT
jgi:hypothetical protein